MLFKGNGVFLCKFRWMAANHSIPVEMHWLMFSTEELEQFYSINLMNEMPIRNAWKQLCIKGSVKDWVSLYCSGCTAVSILRREPTTERHGGFDLLRFRPGPVHPSLGDLVVPGSPRSSISIPNLVRTPDQHSPLQLRGPELKRSASLSLPAAWITGARHCTRRETWALLGPLTFKEITSEEERFLTDVRNHWHSTTLYFLMNLH